MPVGKLAFLRYLNLEVLEGKTDYIIKDTKDFSLISKTNSLEKPLVSKEIQNSHP